MDNNNLNQVVNNEPVVETNVVNSQPVIEKQNKPQRSAAIIIIILLLVAMLLFVCRFILEDKPNTTTTKETTTTAPIKNEEQNTNTINPQSDSEKYNNLVLTSKENKTVKMDDYNYLETGAAYYTNEFFIENNNLYAKIDNENENTKDMGIEKALIKNDMAFVYIGEIGQSEYMFVFASDINGNFYYISNNPNATKHSMWEPVKIDALKNITKVETYESVDSIDVKFIDVNGKTTTFEELNLDILE